MYKALLSKQSPEHESPLSDGSLTKFELAHQEIYFPDDIWINILSFMELKDIAAFIFVCKNFFNIAKRHDENHIQETLIERKKNNSDSNSSKTLINTFHEYTKQLTASLNGLLHKIFLLENINDQERSDLIEKLAQAFSEFKLLCDININDTQTNTELQEYITSYNTMIEKSHHNVAFRNIIVAQLETLRHISTYYHPEEKTRLNFLPFKKDELLHSLYTEDPSNTDIVERELPLSWRDDDNKLRFILRNSPIGSIPLIILNPIATFLYFRDTFNEVFNKSYQEIQSLNCTTLLKITNCSLGEEDLNVFGNCTNAFSFTNSSLICLTPKDDNVTSHPGIWGYIVASVGTGTALAASLEVYFKISWDSSDNSQKLLKYGSLVLSLGLAGLNIFLPYLAQGEWSASQGYNQGCSTGLNHCFNPVFVANYPVSHINEYMHPLIMGTMMTGVIAFANLRTFNLIKNYFQKKEFQNNLKENSVVQKLITYGTFASKKNLEQVRQRNINADIETNVTNDEIATHEVDDDVENSDVTYSRCPTFCTLM